MRQLVVLAGDRQTVLTSVCLCTKPLKVREKAFVTQPTEFFPFFAVTVETGDLSLAISGFPTGDSPHLDLTSWFSSCFE